MKEIRDDLGSMVRQTELPSISHLIKGKGRDKDRYSGRGEKGAGHSFELWLSFDRVICRLDVVETVSIDKSLFFRHLTFFATVAAATGGVGVSLLLPTTRPALGRGWVVVT